MILFDVKVRVSVDDLYNLLSKLSLCAFSHLHEDLRPSMTCSSGVTEYLVHFSEPHGMEVSMILNTCRSKVGRIHRSRYSMPAIDINPKSVYY